jgi:hypothetical protein
LSIDASRQLYSNQLSGTIPESIGDLTHLVALYEPARPNNPESTNNHEPTNVIVLMIEIITTDWHCTDRSIPTTCRELYPNQLAAWRISSSCMQRNHINCNIQLRDMALILCIESTQKTTLEQPDWSNATVAWQAVES